MKATFKTSFIANVEVDNSKKIVLLITDESTSAKSHLQISPADFDRTHLIADKLKNLGVSVPREKGEARKFIARKIEKKMARCRERLVTSSTGWHSSGVFVTLERTYGRSSPLAMHLGRLARPVSCRKNVCLERWKESLKTLTQHSHTAVLAVAHALSGPLLSKVLAITDVPVVNLWSNTSCGKTTLLQLANTCFDAPMAMSKVPTSKVPTFNHTRRAREEALSSRNGLFMPFDEENQSDCLAKFIKDVSSGSGDIRSSTVQESLPDLTWVCAILTSSNRRAVPGGQANTPEGVRIIDVRIKSNEKGGIFERHSENLCADKRSDIIKKCVEVCLENSGAAGHALLTSLTGRDTQKRSFEYAKRKWRDFIDERCSGLTSSQLRVLEKFAVMFASASLSAKLKIVPWTVEEGEYSVDWCYKRYVRQNRSDYLDPKKVHHDVYQVVTNKRLFLPKGIKQALAVKRKSVAVGFRSVFLQVPVACVWDASLDSLANRVGCKGEVLRSLLSKSGVLMRDANMKKTIMLRDPMTGNRKRFVSLDIKRLKKVIE
jgi:hypothetical protein